MKIYHEIVTVITVITVDLSLLLPSRPSRNTRRRGLCSTISSRTMPKTVIITFSRTLRPIYLYYIYTPLEFFFLESQGGRKLDEQKGAKRLRKAYVPFEFPIRIQGESLLRLFQILSHFFKK